MQIKTYNYQSIILFENVIPHLNQFKSEILNDVKYIEIHIQFIHSNGSIEVELCKSIKINIHSKMIHFISHLKKNCKVLHRQFKEVNFTEIQFHYKEISYSEYINPSAQYTKKVWIKKLKKLIRFLLRSASLFKFKNLFIKNYSNFINSLRSLTSNGEFARRK